MPTSSSVSDPPERPVPFRESRLLRGLSAEVIQTALGSLEPMDLEPDVTLFSEGDPPDACYVLEYGAIRIQKRGGDGRIVTLGFMEPGDFFGELALVDGTPRSAEAQTAVPSRVLRIEEPAFRRLLDLAPLEITSAMADRSVARIRAANDNLLRQLEAGGRQRGLGEAVGTVAHNLRSPIATIHNAAELMETFLNSPSPDHAKIESMLAIILRTTHRSLETIEGILEQVREGNRFERGSVLPGELLTEVVEQVAGVVAGRHVELQVESNSEGLLHVERRELVAALENLVRNAVEALPEEGGIVRLSADQAPGGGVTFSVSDTGVGIPEKHLPRIFESGFTHGKREGTGIGLAHVKAVVERHGGTITIDSRLGHGTTVRLTIPTSGSGTLSDE